MPQRLNLALPVKSSSWRPSATNWLRIYLIYTAKKKKSNVLLIQWKWPNCVPSELSLKARRSTGGMALAWLVCPFLSSVQTRPRLLKEPMRRNSLLASDEMDARPWRYYIYIEKKWRITFAQWVVSHSEHKQWWWWWWWWWGVMKDEEWCDDGGRTQGRNEDETYRREWPGVMRRNGKFVLTIYILLQDKEVGTGARQHGSLTDDDDVVNLE